MVGHIYADRDRDAMRDCEVGRGLDGVPEAVPEVHHVADATVKFVLLDDAPFDFEGADNVAL